jgi:hypothetical protein
MTVLIFSTLWFFALLALIYMTYDVCREWQMRAHGWQLSAMRFEVETVEELDPDFVEWVESEQAGGIGGC